MDRRVEPSFSTTTTIYTNEESSLDKSESQFSATVLGYINQVLMEEDNYATTAIRDSLALQHVQKSFYDVIAHNYHPHSPRSSSSSSTHHRLYSYPVFESLPGCSFGDYSFSSGTGSSSSEKDTTSNVIEFNNPFFQSNSNPVTQSSTSLKRRTVEQGTNFLPANSPFIIHPPDPDPDNANAPHVEIQDDVQNGSESESELSQLFDKLLLLGTRLENTSTQQQHIEESNSLPRGGRNRKNRRVRKRRQGNDEQVVDLRTLLMMCAQAISSDDTSTANQLLKQIKQHSSPTGDATQRLAHFFGNALQARLDGTGSHIYSALSSNKNNTSAADMIRAYQVYNSASPFEKLAIIFANNTIWNNMMAKEAETLHIVDFGIRYGFKWPAFIHRISKRPGGPPKLRITGIDLPNSLRRVHETGRRLASYCNRFHVPFEFNAIAKRWETIAVEDLKIRENEFVAVNCLFGFENLLDETVVPENPRDAVLELIRKANPNIFVHGIVNGCYDAPFFVTRFREALFHYSAMFDMLESNIGGRKEDPMRLMFEEEFWGKEVMNVIACEGCERVERPETYKQWELRHMRCGFRSMSLDHQVIQKLRGRLRDDAYSSHFMLEVDGNWLLQGWKGKILYASSSWVPQ